MKAALKGLATSFRNISRDLTRPLIYSLNRTKRDSSKFKEIRAINAP